MITNEQNCKKLISGFYCFNNYLYSEIPPEMAQKYFVKIQELQREFIELQVQILAEKKNDSNFVINGFYSKQIKMIGDDLVTLAMKMIDEEDEYRLNGGE